MEVAHRNCCSDIKEGNVSDTGAQLSPPPVCNAEESRADGCEENRMGNQEEGQCVWEFSIQELAATHDKRWEEVWSSFLSSCTHPVSRPTPPPQWKEQEYLQTKYGRPSDTGDVRAELMSKISGGFKRVVNNIASTLWRSGGKRRDREVGDDSWEVSRGKYSR
jgi:hypothetical protein